MIDSPIANKLIGLRVHENDRKAVTDQSEMSDGMFRALSLIIHYNFYQLSNKPLTVLVDDIGEGLDYNRSTNLIKLLIEKSIKSNIQIIMSSNDKFVLNNTDLKYWQIVNRKANVVSIFNFDNSKEIFENFRFTGLNNFDFYISDFCNEDPQQ
jgi:ABC-type lipoprotein export system ATPase subunit